MAGDDRPPITLQKSDGDIIWLYDLIHNLPVQVHDAHSSAVLVHGDCRRLLVPRGCHIDPEFRCYLFTGGIEHLTEDAIVIAVLIIASPNHHESTARVHCDIGRNLRLIGIGIDLELGSETADPVKRLREINLA